MPHNHSHITINMMKMKLKKRKLFDKWTAEVLSIKKYRRSCEIKRSATKKDKLINS